jgi:hypothetical protein
MFLKELNPEDYLHFIKNEHPVREGCFVKYFCRSKKEIIEGKVYVSKYVKNDNSKHVYIIKKSNGELTAVEASALYSCLIEHKPNL